MFAIAIWTGLQTFGHTHQNPETKQLRFKQNWNFGLVVTGVDWESDHFVKKKIKILTIFKKSFKYSLLTCLNN